MERDEYVKQLGDLLEKAATEGEVGSRDLLSGLAEAVAALLRDAPNDTARLAAFIEFINHVTAYTALYLKNAKGWVVGDDEIVDLGEIEEPDHKH